MRKLLALILPLLLLGIVAGCGGKQEVMPPRTDEGVVVPPDTTGQTTSTETPDIETAKPPEFVVIYFDTDKWFLRDDAKRGLQTNVQIMKDHPDLTVEIEGNCDERNTEEYNLALGEKRARSAYDYMTSLGIAKDRLTMISYGESRPVAFGHDETAWRQNRRCEFRVTN